MHTVKNEVSIAGFYTFFVNGVAVMEVPSKNLITDAGVDYMLQTSSVAGSAGSLLVGTGTAAPTVSDSALAGTVLGTKVGATSLSTGTGTDVNGAYTYQRGVFSFALGAVVGTVAEVGFRFTGASGLHSRSRVVDAGGTPTTFVVTAADQLTVNYELRTYDNTSLSSGNISISGTTYAWVASFLSGTMAGTNWCLLKINTTSTVTAYAHPAYLAGNTAYAGHAITAITSNTASDMNQFTCALAPAEGNFGSGLGAITFRLTTAEGHTLRFAFSTAVPKVANVTLTLTMQYVIARV